MIHFCRLGSSLVATLIAVLLTSAPVLAQSAHEMHVGAQEEQICDPALLHQAGMTLKIPDLEDKLLASACKTWPLDRNEIIVALAYDSGKESSKSLVLAFLNTRTGKPSHRYDGEIDEDATMRVEGGSLWIDTARYDVAPHVRAFGLDVTSGYIAHCGDGGVGAQRSLYVLEGAHIRRILDSMTMSTWTFVQGGNPRCMSQEVAEKAPPTIIENTVMSIEVSAQTTKGYADLIVTPIVSRDNNPTLKQRGKPVVVQYDGNKYPTLW